MECKIPHLNSPQHLAKSSLRFSVNPNGLLIGGAAVAFLAAVPVTSYITAPGGVLQSFVEATVRLVPGTANIPKERVLPALSALYIFVSFGATGAFSAAGQAMANEKGLDDNRTSAPPLLPTPNPTHPHLPISSEPLLKASISPG